MCEVVCFLVVWLDSSSHTFEARLLYRGQNATRDHQDPSFDVSRPINFVVPEETLDCTRSVRYPCLDNGGHFFFLGDFSFFLALFSSQHSTLSLHLVLSTPVVLQEAACWTGRPPSILYLYLLSSFSFIPDLLGVMKNK